MAIPLRLRRRRDGSLCLTDSYGRTSGDDREFPQTHGFTMDWLVNNSNVARMTGDEITLNMANACALYRVTDRRADAVDVELVESSLFDPAPIDDNASGVLDATRAVVDSTATDQAATGSVAVTGEDA